MSGSRVAEKDKDVEILIVGGGPAGSLSAITLGRKHNVFLAEEHQTAGFPVQCAGLISEECFNSYRKYCRIGRAVENKIKGALFFSPSGKYLEVKGRAYAIERKILDSMLFARASEFAEVTVKAKLGFEGDCAVIGSRRIGAGCIVGADGIYSAVARHFGFERPGLFLAVQTELKFEPIDESFVELYFGRHYSDGFFAYSIPLGDTARVGVVSKSRPDHYLENLISKHPSVSERVKGSIVELNVGAIPDRLVEFVKGNVALVGDAAGMVKPYTGGGLYYLLIAAEKLAECYPSLRQYKESYLKELRREYSMGMKIRKLYSTLEESDYDELIGIFRNFDFSTLDMDRASTILSIASLILNLVRRPKIGLKIFAALLS